MDEQATAATRKKQPSAVVCMRPSEFLRLTTKDDTQLFWIVEHAQSFEVYDDYDDYTASINVDVDTGKILSHDGRHRVAAWMKAGADEIKVRVYLWKNIVSDAVPTTLHGQYRTRRTSHRLTVEEFP